jgi:hypothetical protein
VSGVDGDYYYFFPIATETYRTSGMVCSPQPLVIEGVNQFT